MIVDDDDNLKLVDFGFAIVEDVAQTVLGSAGYRAPELVPGHKYGFKVDIYSVGMTLLSALTQTRPPPINPSLHPDSFLDMVANLLRKKGASEECAGFICELVHPDESLRKLVTTALSHSFIRAEKRAVPWLDGQVDVATTDRVLSEDGWDCVSDSDIPL